MSDPLVSVLMPAYNHERFVEQSVRSVWEQTYRNLELIVIDDGSHDRTPEILRRLEAASPIPMRVLVQENVGTTRTMNRLFALARGEFIALIASDDLHLPELVATLLEALRNAPPETGLAFGDAYVLDRDGRRVDRYLRTQRTPRSGWIYEDLLLRKWMLPLLASLTRASAFREAGGYNEASQVDDLELLMRIARKHPVVFVDRCLAEYRGHHSNDQLTRQIARMVPDWCRLFEEGLRDHPRAASRWWSLYARGHFYYRVGHSFYNVRELPTARRWLVRALLRHPLQGTAWSLLLRSFAGARLLDRVSRLKARLRPSAADARDDAPRPTEP